MKFLESDLPGVFILELDRKADERGFFARTWCEQEFAAHGLAPRMVQCNVGFSERAGTLRGIHFQIPPHAEAKLIRCTRGALFDVAVDLRPDSPACGHWIAQELTEDNHKMLYVPEGFGHAC
ncbi:MAG: dTDP-4-dehydrorhamnose 3,5-epimerase family protein, partial [Thermoguttaceae bacterium]